MATETMASTPSPTPEINRNRLPTLFEVLTRRTLAPVDLFSFYVYMRDQQRSVDYLDFWLDVSQHMALCRHYVRELRRSVLIDTPELDKASKRSSAQLEAVDPDAAGPSTDRQSRDQRLSAFLRSDRDSSKHSPSNSQGSQQSTPSATQQPRPAYIQSSQNNSPGTGDSTTPGTNSSPQHTVTRHDIRASAEKILYTYLLPGSEREIILPQSILNQIVDAIENQGRDDPEVFDSAKDYVFQAMERDAFPGFLKSKALGNLVPPSLMMRMVLGCIALFAALWTGFTLIFLDYSRRTRCWVILPFALGIYLLLSHQFQTDPILALIGFSEYTFMSFTRIKERYVRRLLITRAWGLLFWIVLTTAALCCLFIFVPGKHL